MASGTENGESADKADSSAVGLADGDSHQNFVGVASAEREELAGVQEEEEEQRSGSRSVSPSQRSPPRQQRSVRPHLLP